MFFTATRLNIFCCHSPHIKRSEFQEVSIRYWWIKVFRQILCVQTFKCFIYNIPVAFHKHVITLNNRDCNIMIFSSSLIWNSFFVLQVFRLGLKQYQQSANTSKLLNALQVVLFFVLSGQLKLLWQHWKDLFFKTKGQNLYGILCIQLPILNNLNQFL